VRKFAFRRAPFSVTTQPVNDSPNLAGKSASAAHTISGWRLALLWPLVLVVRLWWRTLRLEIDPEERRTFETNTGPVAFVLWHNRLFLVPEFYRRYRGGRPVYGLVSASRDGAWLAALFRLVGMGAVRGSSSQRAREAATAMVAVLRAGHDIGITPDGPRGPCYDFKPGALIVTRHAGAPMLLLGVEFSSAWRLRSWDRFYLPRPFSRARVRCVRAEPDAGADRAAAAAAVAARLRELNPDPA
jgi:lysophospholipid acyltransferase (LPLAT)-like uncharacterized protein